MYFILHSIAQIPTPIKKARPKNNTRFQLILFSLYNIIAFNLPLLILPRRGKMFAYGINGESLIIIILRNWYSIKIQLFFIYPIYIISISTFAIMTISSRWRLEATLCGLMRLDGIIKSCLCVIECLRSMINEEKYEWHILKILSLSMYCIDGQYKSYGIYL